ncbi:hypothetical protein Ocin01_09707 [Orchesella cincta]|uniref:Uncharacterized protein n=1 Tax=Orchesella cincta TaxID=48709 RepID=A0A1D2MVN5_ORCCI|nr:hypothetical protein Ocin01_09707 [Orchesella cincta]
MTPAVPTPEQNPKSILADRHSTEKSSSLRVTFAKPPPNKSLAAKQRDVSSPVAKPATPGQKKSKKVESKLFSVEKQATPPASAAPASRNSSSTSKVGTATLSSFYQSLKESAKAGEKKVPELVPEKSKPNNARTSSATALSSRRKSSESVGHASKRSTLTTSSRRGVKPKKYKRSTPKISRNSSKTPSLSRRSKSGKRLKKRVKSAITTSKSKDSDLNSFKPAKLNEEYARELNNITQILRAVSNFDANTGTGSGVVDTARERVKVTTIVEGKRSNTANTEVVHRPLSADELKQLLSSITRVVSLHQLPVGDPKNNGAPGRKSPTPPSTANEIFSSIHKTESLLKVLAANNATNTSTLDILPKLTNEAEGGTSKKKKGRKGKDLSTGGGDEGRSKQVAHKFKSKVSIRKGRSRSRVKDDVTGRSSSVSSSEKDPVQNAAFLRKYFEESVRLATKKSSEELNLNGDEGDNSKKKKHRKGTAKRASSKSIAQRKLSSLSVIGTKIAKSESKTKADANRGKQLENQTSSPAIRDFLKKEQASLNSERPKSKGPGENKKDSGLVRKPFKTSTNVSTTTVLKPLPSVKRGTSETKLKGRKSQQIRVSKVRSKSQGPLSTRRETKQDDENDVSSEGVFRTKAPDHSNDLVESFLSKMTNESANISKFRPVPQAPVKFQITDPMKNSVVTSTKSQKQFDNVQDMVNSKYAQDTAKMKSIWDKTPYQPMTHERFKELVSKYTHVDVLHGFKEENREQSSSSRQRTPTEKKSRESTTSKKPEKTADEQHKKQPTFSGLVTTPPKSALKTPIYPFVRVPNPEKLLILPKPWEFEPESTVPVKHEPTIQQLQPPPTTISKWIGSDAGSVYNKLNYDYNEERLSIMRQAHRARQRLREETAHRRKSMTKGPIGGPLVEEPANDEYNPLTFYRNAVTKKNARNY